jgi:hypothetical protein
VIVEAASAVSNVLSELNVLNEAAMPAEPVRATLDALNVPTVALDNSNVPTVSNVRIKFTEQPFVLASPVTMTRQSERKLTRNAEFTWPPLAMVNAADCAIARLQDVVRLQIFAERTH